MKRKTRVRLNNVKTFAILMFTAVFALLALPFGAIKALRTAPVEVEAATNDNVGGSVRASATADVELTVYYYDKAGDYEDYNLWVWDRPNGKGENYEAVSKFDDGTVELEDYPGKLWKKGTVTMHNVDASRDDAIGVIVRKGAWVAQTADLLVEGSKIENNAVTVYVVRLEGEGVKPFPSKMYYTAEDAMSNKITSAYFKNLTTVKIETSAPIKSQSIFKVKDETGAVLGTLDCSLSDNSGVLNLTEADITLSTGNEVSFKSYKKYTIVDEPTEDFDTAVNFASTSVSINKIFDLPAFSQYEYDGTLGAEYSQAQTKFTVWSPSATSMKVKIYNAGEGGVGNEYDMVEGEKGEWTYTLAGDQNGKYYTYLVGNGTSYQEIVDPYARSAGRNGKRGMILDLDSTDPEGWANHTRPAARASYSDAVIYETHIRDLTMHESSNVSAEHKGKFLGLTERASEANGNKKTPLDHIVALGVTEVHILPMFDINSVDEYTGLAQYDGAGQYNWGYDPLNYNVPEGSYSTDPTDGAVRVKELKEMIMALHKAGIRVIMDVVYNHVADAGNSNFQALMPNYYFRTNADGSFTSGSGCGNDTASERAMYHKFMVESVNYWADEYQLDGFRFDLMGLHDTVTMNKIYDTLNAPEKNRDTIMVYGEGWEMGTMVETATKKKADMFHADEMPNIAFFDDATRDKLKGGGFGRPMTEKGFIEGAKQDAAIYMGAVGATNNKSAGYSSLGKDPWAVNPVQNINYVSCHDNSTLWDKINACATTTDEATLKDMNRLGAAAVLTSQGPAFFLAGEEMLRSKHILTENLTYNEENNTYEDRLHDGRPEKWLHQVNGEDYYFADNSYKSPDSVNAIDWTLAETNSDMVEFYTQLIALRKNTPQFRLTTKTQIDSCVKIIDANMRNGITSYAIKDPNGSDEYVVVLFNVTDAAAEVDIPDGTYSVYVNGARANATTPLSTATGNKFTVGAYSAVVMKANLNADKITAWQEVVKPSAPVITDEGDDTEVTPEDEGSNLGLALGLGIGIPAVVLIAGGVVFGVMLTKKKGKKGESEAPATQTVEAGDVPEEQSTEEAAEQEQPTDEQ